MICSKLASPRGGVSAARPELGEQKTPRRDKGEDKAVR